MGKFQCRCGAPVERTQYKCSRCGRVLEWGTLERSANNIDWRNGLIWTVLFLGVVWIMWQVLAH